MNMGKSVIDFNEKKGFICDMDGVIYHGNQILPGVPEFIQWLHDEKKEYLFLTNNSNICRKELYKLQINYVKESKLKDDMLICGKELEQGFIMIGSVEGCRTFECQGQFRF